MDVSQAEVVPVERESSARMRSPDLTWLTSVLWPDADVRVSPKRVPPGERVAEAYAVVPSASRPRLLIPFSSPSLAEPAMRRYNDAISAFASARREVEWRFATSSIGWARFPPLVVFFDRDPRPDELLTHHVRDIFERPDAALAISFGSPRPNRKPTVQVLTLDGEVLGFGKVGWNEPTRAVIANEVAALRRLERDPPVGFRVPDLVHEGPWREHTLSITAPVPTCGRSRHRRGRMPPPEITREIARRGGIAVTPFASTPWWRSVHERGASADDSTRVVLRWMHDLHGRRLLWHGSWHGDWSPQNLATVDGVLYVWNWERARDGVPLGLDPIHFAFQSAMRRGRDVRRAVHVAMRRSALTLRALGVPSGDDPLLMACYLAELLVRFEEGRRYGAEMRPGMLEALLAELRRWVARS